MKDSRDVVVNWNCENCGKNFYTDIVAESPLVCCYCGHFDIYGTYSYYIEPTMIECYEEELE